MTTHREGLLSIHASVFIFGLTALFSKLISLTAVEITFVRSIFAALAIAFYILWLKGSLLLHYKRDYLIALDTGFFSGCALDHLFSLNAGLIRCCGCYFTIHLSCYYCFSG